jgi:hypothetical protein
VVTDLNRMESSPSASVTTYRSRATEAATCRPTPCQRR